MSQLEIIRKSRGGGIIKTKHSDYFFHFYWTRKNQTITSYKKV